MEHGAQELLFELFAIFLAAKIIGEIFERFKLPAVLGEILAGAAVVALPVPPGASRDRSALTPERQEGDLARNATGLYAFA